MTGLVLTGHVDGFVASLRENGLARTTVVLYRTRVLQFLQWAGDRVVTRGLLYEYRDWLQTEKPKPGKQDRGCRPRTVNGALCALRAFQRYLLTLDLGGDVPPPATGIHGPRPDLPRRAVPTLAELRRLFEAAERAGAGAVDPEFAAYLRGRALAILCLTAACGLRSGELLALRVSDLRTDTEPWRVVVKRGKGGESRSHALGETEQRYLREWLQVRARRLEGRPDPGTLLINHKGQRMGERSKAHVCQTLCQMAGLPAFTLHGIRHRSCTEVVARHGLKVGQQFMGHASAQTTMLYLHAGQEEVDAAGAALSDTIHRTAGEPRATAEKESPQAARLRRLRRRTRNG